MMFGALDTFLTLFGGGFLVSALYDVYRHFWYSKHRLSWVKHIGDALFCLCAAVTIISVLFYANWGELRLYVFLGLGCGIFTYFKVVKLILLVFSRRT